MAVGQYRTRRLPTTEAETVDGHHTPEDRSAERLARGSRAGRGQTTLLHSQARHARCCLTVHPSSGAIQARLLHCAREQNVPRRRLKRLGIAARPVPAEPPPASDAPAWSWKRVCCPTRVACLLLAAEFLLTIGSTRQSAATRSRCARGRSPPCRPRKPRFCKAITMPPTRPHSPTRRGRLRRRSQSLRGDRPPHALDVPFATSCSGRERVADARTFHRAVWAPHVASGYGPADIVQLARGRVFRLPTCSGPPAQPLVPGSAPHR